MGEHLSLLVEDSSKILLDLQTILGSKYYEIQFNTSTQLNELYLKFFIKNVVQLDPSIDILYAIEYSVTKMLYNTGEAHSPRTVEPFKDNREMCYIIKLKNLDNFIKKISELAKLKVDKEFMEALEDKISE